MQILDVLIDSLTRNIDKEVLFWLWLGLRVLRSAFAFFDGDLALYFFWGVEIPMTDKSHPNWSFGLSHQRYAFLPQWDGLLSWFLALHSLYLQRIAIFGGRFGLGAFLFIRKRIIFLYRAYFLWQSERPIIFQLKCFIFFISDNPPELQPWWLFHPLAGVIRSLRVDFFLKGKPLLGELLDVPAFQTKWGDKHL